MRFFIGTLILLSLFTVLVFFSDFNDIMSIFNREVILIVAYISFNAIGVLIQTSSFKIFFNSYKAIASEKYIFDEADLQKAINLFKLLSKTVKTMSVILFIIANMYVLWNMSYEYFVLATFSTGLVLNLRVLVYGILIPVVFFETTAYILKSKSSTT